MDPTHVVHYDLLDAVVRFALLNLSRLHCSIPALLPQSSEAMPQKLKELERHTNLLGKGVDVLSINSGVHFPVSKTGASMLTSATAPAADGGQYAAASYWDNRYACDNSPTHFDWLFTYSAFRHLMALSCGRRLPCLHAGCGTSFVGEGLRRDGYKVVNIDISQIAIEQMERQHDSGVHGKALPAERVWQVADCRHMPQFQDGSFGSVLDKVRRQSCPFTVCWPKLAAVTA